MQTFFQVMCLKTDLCPEKQAKEVEWPFPASSSCARNNKSE